MDGVVISEILSWQQAVVAVVIVVAVLVVPQVVGLLQNRAIRHELKPNSGSSVRDAVDRIERKLDAHVEAEAARMGAIRERLDKLDNE